MSKVFAHMTMSLDGYVADHNDQVGELFEWYSAGDVAVPTTRPDLPLMVDQASAEFLGELIASTGVLIAGRRVFDITDGWNDNHPAGAPVVVVTHNTPEHPERWPRTTFEHSVEDAIARARTIAGAKDVNILSPNIIQQALDLGLVDEIRVSLTPVIFGAGIPYLATHQRHLLEDPTTVIQGRRAIHLIYPVRRSEGS
ncbi:MAG TPA: dihydrofolate reductase family protein [Pseudonocardiaceae bacterium]|nr:dihydrofolate reductase family protein [Pseudonocardiaceae bacterium]